MMIYLIVSKVAGSLYASVYLHLDVSSINSYRVAGAVYVSVDALLPPPPPNEMLVKLVSCRTLTHIDVYSLGLPVNTIIL